jgi:addiction module RelE/StbE family toxin
MPKIRWSKPSIEDLIEIKQYIAKDSPKVAQQFIEKLIEMVEHLEKFPQLGKKVPKQKDPNVRMLFYRKYRIIYQIYEDFLEIIRVEHDSRFFQYGDDD